VDKGSIIEALMIGKLNAIAKCKNVRQQRQLGKENKNE